MIQLALIGTGRWGQQYIQAIKKLKKCKLQYVCSLHIHEKKISDSFVKIADYKELVRFDHIDGIIVASPSETHFPVASYFLKRNYNLLIEKPLSNSYANAVKLANLQKKSSSIVQVSNIFYYQEVFREMRKHIDTVGQIFFIDSNAGKDFSFKPGRSLSALWEWAPHEIEICTLLLQETPKAVSAWSVGKANHERMVNIQLFYPGGIKVFVKTGWLFSGKTRTLSVNGLNGSLVFDSTVDAVVTRYTLAGETLKYEVARKQLPLEQQVDEFVEAIKKNRPPVNDFNHGLQIVKVLHFIQQSIKNNGAIMTIP